MFAHRFSNPLIFTLTQFLLLNCIAGLGFSDDTSRPNVVMIIVDDMNDYVGCLGGSSNAKTPSLDRLAARGMLFSNAHCAAPVCNPSRVAVMTGKHPSTTGIYDNATRWHKALPEVASIPKHFRDHGYLVVGGGKVNHHMPGFNRRSDWDEYLDQIFDSHYQAQLARGMDMKSFRWPDGFPLNGLEAVKAFSHPPENPNEFDWGPWDQQDNEMGDGQLVEWASEFLKQSHDRPFFLAAGIYRPHLPFYAPRKYFDLFPLDRIQMPLVKADDLDDLPELGKKMAQDRAEDFKLVVQEKRYRELVQAYLANIAYADALIGKLIESLDQSPYAENTIVVVWSDHGWHLGEKNHLHKFTLWERSTRVPLIIVEPRPIAGNARCNRPVSLIDLFPTLNELCNLPQVEGLDGRSLVPLLKDPSQSWDRPALTTHGRGNHALRTEQYRYIRYADGSEELYDHKVDPHEWHNISEQPSSEGIKKELKQWFPKSDAALRTSKKKNRN